jgi:hypothetical protein
MLRIAPNTLNYGLWRAENCGLLATGVSCRVILHHEVLYVMKLPQKLRNWTNFLKSLRFVRMIHSECDEMLGWETDQRIILNGFMKKVCENQRFPGLAQDHIQ